MSNGSTMIARIRRELNRSTAMMSAGVIVDAINTAIGLHRQDRFWFNEKRVTLGTSEGQAFYDIPEDFIDDDALVLIDAVTWREMIEKKAYQYVEERQQNVNWKSRPTYYAIHDNQFYFYPTPDRSYDFLLAYHYDLSAGGGSHLVSENAANAWLDPSAGEQLIRLEAKIELLTNYIRGPEAVQEAIGLSQLKDRAFNSMRSRYLKRKRSGYVIPWGP